MTNATGDATCATCQRLSYDEYGFLGGGSPSGQPYRYTCRRFDEETGLYYYRARYYTPVLGRFLQTDPIGYTDDVNLDRSVFEHSPNDVIGSKRTQDITPEIYENQKTLLNAMYNSVFGSRDQANHGSKQKVSCGVSRGPARSLLIHLQR